MRHALSHLTHRLPGVCQVCARWPARPICVECVQRFAAYRQRCVRCAVPLVADRPLCGACQTHHTGSSLSRCVVAVDYGYPWDDLIARFKFRNEPGWASSLASLLLLAPGACDLLQCSNLMVPIPLATTRLAERGYNQAWELSKALQRQASDHGILTLPGIADGLLRVGDLPDQHSLPREQRLRNLRGAFVANPVRVAQLKGKQVLLVDDVTTTGTTLQSAAQALLRAGATRVTALAFARTEPH